MTILSPFKHELSVSSEGQPVKPVMPVAQDNIFAAAQDIATAIGSDADIYGTKEVDKQKVTTSVSHAVSLATRTKDYVASGVVDQSVDATRDFAVVSEQIDYAFSNVIQHAGFGSAAVRVESFMANEGIESIPVAAFVDAETEVSATADGFVTAFATPTEVTLACAGHVASETFHTVDYRWGHDAVLPAFANSGNSSPFTFVRGTQYILAVRVRITITPGGSIADDAWSLYFAHTSAPTTWTKVDYASDISVAATNLYEFDQEDPIPVDRFVTRTGPGVPLLANGILASADMQAINLTPAASTETEIQFCIVAQLGVPTGNYYLKLICEGDTPNTMQVLYPSLSLPWIIGLT